MKKAVAPRKNPEKRDHTPAVTKTILSLAFALGLVIIFLGITGMREYGTSGFSSETAYNAIYFLHRNTEAAYAKLSAQLNALPEDQRAAAEKASGGTV